MSSVLFAALDQPGHCLPLVPLARACEAAGHDVRFATAAGAHGILAAAGIAVVDAGVGIRETFTDVSRRVTASPSGMTLREARVDEAFVRVAGRAFVRDVGAIIDRDAPGLVVADAACLGAVIAAEQRGVPSAVHGLGLRPDGVTFPLGLIERGFAELAVEHGLARSPSGVLGGVYVDPCPGSLGPPVSSLRRACLPIRPIPWADTGSVVPRRPSTARPWVYVTFGSVVDAPELLAGVLAGVQRCDVDVIVAAGATHGVRARDPGSRISVERWVDQAAVLVDADVVVHHGGSGTMLAAAACEVPQLIIPSGADQHANASAVQAVGAGRRISGDSVAPETVAEALRGLLSGDASSGARRLATEIAAMPTPNEVAAQLVPAAID